MTLGQHISAQLAVTDHDGDTVTQSVMIGNDIQFNDDGPKVVGSGTVTYHADEGDIVTLLSVGTSPDDGNADGSTTGHLHRGAGDCLGLGAGRSELRRGR